MVDVAARQQGHAVAASAPRPPRPACRRLDAVRCALVGVAAWRHRREVEHAAVVPHLDRVGAVRPLVAAAAAAGDAHDGDDQDDGYDGRRHRRQNDEKRQAAAAAAAAVARRNPARGQCGGGRRARRRRWRRRGGGRRGGRHEARRARGGSHSDLCGGGGRGRGRGRGGRQLGLRHRPQQPVVQPARRLAPELRSLRDDDGRLVEPATQPGETRVTAPPGARQVKRLERRQPAPHERRRQRVQSAAEHAEVAEVGEGREWVGPGVGQDEGRRQPRTAVHVEFREVLERAPDVAADGDRRRGDVRDGQRPERGGAAERARREPDERVAGQLEGGEERGV